MQPVMTAGLSVMHIACLPRYAWCCLAARSWAISARAWAKGFATSRTAMKEDPPKGATPPKEPDKIEAKP
jgi:hypothetical protein